MIKVLSGSLNKVRFVHVSSILVAHLSNRTITTSNLSTKRKEFDEKTWNKIRVREIRLNLINKVMNPEEITKALNPLRISVKEQGKKLNENKLMIK